MSRFQCWIRSKAARLRGIVWDGHCWKDAVRGVRCMDCGKFEGIR